MRISARSRSGPSARTLQRVAVIAALALVISFRCTDAQESGGEAEGVVVNARVSPDHVPLGTPFRYTVEVEAPSDAEVIVPVLSGRLGDFTVVDFGDEPVREKAGRVVVTRWYDLVTYETGYQLIPGLPVQYRDESGELKRVDGDDIGIRIVSLVDGQGAAEDIRDIRGPVQVPFDWVPVWIGLAALGGVVSLALLVRRILRRINAPAAVASRPPDEIALEELGRLSQRRLLDAEERAEWYVALSGIVRRYIEARFGLRAPEMTTEEFIQAVQKDSPLLPVHRQLLGDFLADCDLVKFARHVPAQEDAERAYARARDFIHETRPKPAAAEGRRAA